MFSETIFEYLSNPFLVAAFSAILAYWACSRIQPVIILLSREKNLMDEPEERSSHEFRVPTYGGAAIFFVFSVLVMSMACLLGFTEIELNQVLALMAAISVLFFLGIKDDMIGLDPTKKFVGQLIASIIVVVLADVRILSLEGIFGIGQLPYMGSVLFSIFVFMLMVNAYNLIDGIDGLAGAIVTIASAVFGAFFLGVGATPVAVISFVLIGAMLGFLRFNLSHKRKIFMGDSGSLFIGFLLAYQAIMFLNINLTAAQGPVLDNAPVIVLTVLSYPLMDTLRVFFLRAIRGRSPFSPDRNHIHHRLLDLGMSHKQATALLSLKTILLIAVCWNMQETPIHIHLVSMLVMGFVLYLGILAMRRNKIRTIDPIQIKEPNVDEGIHASREIKPKPLVRAPYQAEKRTEDIRETATAGD